MTALMEQVVSVMTATRIRIVPATKLKVVVKYPGKSQNSACLEALASAKAARRMLIVRSIKHVVIQNAFKEKVVLADTAFPTPVVPAARRAAAANAKKVMIASVNPVPATRIVKVKRNNAVKANVQKVSVIRIHPLTCHSSLAYQLA